MENIFFIGDRVRNCNPADELAFGHQGTIVNLSIGKTTGKVHLYCVEYDDLQDCFKHLWEFPYDIEQIDAFVELSDSIDSLI